jgi:anti-sigma factor RsiW
MECTEARVSLGVWLDDELDAESSLALERHLETCAACARARDEALAQRRAVRDALPRFSASDTLRARIQRDAREHVRASAPRRAWSLNPVLGGFVGAAATWVVVAGIWLLAQPGANATFANEALASHVRALQGTHLTDVLSSDRHTVKPWFAGKLDYSPPVTDFASRGFPLVGGRLDYVGGRPVAVLVYARNKHVIDLYVWPTEARDAGTRTTSRRGYQMLRAVRSRNEYWAISDLNEAELREFLGFVVTTQ